MRLATGAHRQSPCEDGSATAAVTSEVPEIRREARLRRAKADFVQSHRSLDRREQAGMTGGGPCPGAYIGRTTSPPVMIPG